MLEARCIHCFSKMQCERETDFYAELKCEKCSWQAFAFKQAVWPQLSNVELSYVALLPKKTFAS